MSVRNRKKPTKLNIPRLEQPLSPIQTEPQKNITGILKTTTPSATNTIPDFSRFRNDSNTQSLISLKRKWAGKKCHLPSTSLLSTGSGWSDYRGCLNLAVILLVISNSRMIIENFTSFGVRVDPLQWFEVFTAPQNFPNVILAVITSLFSINSVLIEKHILRKKIRGYDLHLINIVSLFFYGTIHVLIQPFSPAVSIATLGYTTVTILKLWSYAQTNYWYRTETLDKPQNKMKRSRSLSENMSVKNYTYAPESLRYPSNINILNMIEFIIMPTLCYEIDFPRNERIRKTFLLKRGLEIVILTQVQFCLIQQWIVPTLQTAVPKVAETDHIQITERLLRLALPNHIVWLVFFYLFFHSILNFLAEITKFSDREFYRDWWNAKDIAEFWQLWNIPVHKWCVRHLYKPLLKAKYSKTSANLIVFAFSAFFHEYLISVPMKMLRFYAFGGMILQFPLVFLSGLVCRLFGKNYGNMVVWLSLICGQPIACLMYVYDHYAASNSLEYFKQFV